MKRRIRIIDKFRIDYIIPEDPKFPGHQLVPAPFGERIKALASLRRKITFREVEAAFTFAVPDYERITEGRERRLRGPGGQLRWQADKAAHTLLSYVMQMVPAVNLPPITGNLSLCEAMANAFGCGHREIELAWNKREIGKKKRQNRVKR